MRTRVVMHLFAYLQSAWCNSAAADAELDHC